MNRLLFLISVIVFTVSSYGCHSTNGDRQRQGFSTSDEYARLLDLAMSKGSIKIIVKLKVPGIEDLRISAFRQKDPAERDSAEKEIAARIKEEADSVIRLLAGTDFSINHRYSTLPLLALEVSPDALKKLAYSEVVSSIIEDKPIPLN
jgi:hypothetical protein